MADTEEAVEQLGMNTASVPERKPAAPERQFATPDDIPSVSFAEIELRVLKKWVRVRYLGIAEVASLTMLPELSRFTALMEEQQKIIQQNQEIAKKNEQRDQDKPELPLAKLPTPEEQELVSERLRYMTRAAHMALVADPMDTDEAECPDCSLRHVRSLWSIKQTQLLHYDDLAAVVNTAERNEAVDPTSRSSRGEMEPPTDESASDGGSTPAPTS